MSALKPHSFSSAVIFVVFEVSPEAHLIFIPCTNHTHTFIHISETLVRWNEECQIRRKLLRNAGEPSGPVVIGHTIAPWWALFYQRRSKYWPCFFSCLQRWSRFPVSVAEKITAEQKIQSQRNEKAKEMQICWIFHTNNKKKTHIDHRNELRPKKLRKLLMITLVMVYIFLLLSKKSLIEAKSSRKLISLTNVCQIQYCLFLPLPQVFKDY